MSFPFDQLIHWFKNQKRDLPWREGTTTPYAVWISEVMLQQTQVSVVIPYYLRWMDRFPTIQHLAAASEEEVIKLWEGLGYYSRARNLHEGARFVLKNFNGQLPNDHENLSKIKGLGDYTVGAILSFAFHQRVPAVDGNVLRVMTRYFLNNEDISKAKTVKNIQEHLKKILPHNEPWTATEALIELGATICQKKPKCLQCPLKQTCKAFNEAKTEQLPFKSSKTTTQHLYRSVAIIQAKNHLLLRKASKGEIMAGLHEFPYFEMDSKTFNPNLLQTHLSQLGLTTTLITILPKTRHSFTHHQAHLFPALFHTTQTPEIPNYQWIPIPTTHTLAFSSGHRRIFDTYGALPQTPAKGSPFANP